MLNFEYIEMTKKSYQTKNKEARPTNITNRQVKNLTTGKVYKKISLAAADTNLSIGMIYAACLSRPTQTNGAVMKYAGLYNPETGQYGKRNKGLVGDTWVKMEWAYVI